MGHRFRWWLHMRVGGDFSTRADCGRVSISTLALDGVRTIAGLGSWRPLRSCWLAGVCNADDGDATIFNLVAVAAEFDAARIDPRELGWLE